jgi:heme oxygenase
MTGERLSARLRAATRAMHAAAERSGIMSRLLRGDIDLAAYCLLLRNLHALYAALEGALDRHMDSPEVAPVRFPALFRTAAVSADLSHLHGDGWGELPLAAATQSYCARIDALCGESAGLLVAHAYVRYMGDLSGGQILRPIVRRALGLAKGAGTQFYAFGDRGEIEAQKERLRAAIDALPIDAAAAEAVVAEANDAFVRHAQLFEALQGTCLTPSTEKPDG